MRRCAQRSIGSHSAVRGGSLLCFGDQPGSGFGRGMDCGGRYGKRAWGGGLSLNAPLWSAESSALAESAGERASSEAGASPGAALFSHDAVAFSANPVPINTIGDTYGTSGSATFALNTIGAHDGIDSFTFVGPYRFNITGNTVTRGKNDSLYHTALHGDPDAEEAVGYAFANPYGYDRVAKAYVSNSSTAVLSPRSVGAKVHRAFLVAVGVTPNTRAAKPAQSPLSVYGVSIKGPKGDINRYFPSLVYGDRTGNVTERQSMVVDITDFVKEQGWGTYAGINIPYCQRQTPNIGTDFFAAWKIIVIEEDSSLPTRMIRLRMGGTTVSKGTPTTVDISGDGLYVANENGEGPTGENLVSMDGCDAYDSNQRLAYWTDVTGTSASPLFVSNEVTDPFFRPTNAFFSFHIDIDGQLVDVNPGPTISYKGQHGIAGSGPFYGQNTDLSLMTVNNPDNPGSMQLEGGEQQVVMTVDSNNAPTLLSALGLAVDIVVPEFETELVVSNGKKNYATSDPGYKLERDYAEAGEPLRATMISRNVSKQEHLGIQDAAVTVQLPAFASIDPATVQAHYCLADGTVAPFEHVDIKQVDGVWTIVATSLEVDAITYGGYFEVVAEGTANGTNEFTTYDNEAFVAGTFVQNNEVYEDFQMDKLGVAQTITSSDRTKYDVTVSTVGPGAAGIVEAPPLPDEGPYETAGVFYGDESALVAWRAEGDGHVAMVMVDGVVRDDLLNAGCAQVPVENASHEVLVVFTADPLPAPGEPLQVETEGDEGVDITPTATLPPGSDHTVSWSVKPGFVVGEVTVDGVPMPPSLLSSMDFTALSSNHKVVVKTTVVDPTRVKVTTIVRGPGAITPSATVSRGSDYRVEWSPRGDAALSLVKVNGVVVFDKNKDTPTKPQERPWAYVLKDLQADAVVEVVFLDPDRTPDAPEDLVVRTELLGGEGSITPSFTVAPHGGGTVLWTVGDGYAVKSVTVMRGDERIDYPTDSTKIELADITTNCLVSVVLERQQFSVGTSISGGSGGTITPSITGLAPGASATVSWTVPSDSVVTTVVVDGVVRDDLLAAGSVSFEDIQANHTVAVTLAEKPLWSIVVTSEGPGTAGQSATVRDGDDHAVSWAGDDGALPVKVVVDGVERPDLIEAGGLKFEDVAANHTVHVVFPIVPDYTITTAITGGPGTITPSVTLKAGSSHTVSWEAAEGWKVKQVLVDGAVRSDLVMLSSMAFLSVDTDHRIEVQLEQIRWKVTVTHEGAGTAGPSAEVLQGADHTVTWAPTSGAKVASVEIDGVNRPDLLEDGSFTFADLQGDHTVHVVFEQDPPPARLFQISVVLEGGPGKTAGTGSVPEGSDCLTTWKPAEGYRVTSVIVDGVERPDLIDAGQLSFAAVDHDHKVVVKLEQEPRYTVTTEIVGAPGGTITPSAGGLLKGADHKVAWTVPAGCRISSVTVDGVVRDDLLEADEIEFRDLSADHHVVVTVEANEEPPDPEKFLIDVTWEGPGAASGGGAYDAGSDRRVTWTGTDGARPVRIVIDGEERPELLGADGIDFRALAANHQVHIVFEKPEKPQPPDNPTPPGPVIPGTDPTVPGGPVDPEPPEDPSRPTGPETPEGPNTPTAPEKPGVPSDSPTGEGDDSQGNRPGGDDGGPRHDRGDGGSDETETDGSGEDATRLIRLAQTGDGTPVAGFLVAAAGALCAVVLLRRLRDV